MSYDVIGIGNAIMDMIAPIEDARLTALGIERGIMQLVDQSRAEELTVAQEMADGAADGRAHAQVLPGGSVANTLAGIGKLGLRTGFIGRVANDPLGLSYAEQCELAGTRFLNPPVAGDSLPTSRSLIFVSPDGERSMNTYLGISAEISPDDVDPAAFQGVGWLFLEGYLFDKAKGKQAFLKAAELAHAAGGRAGIALSDPFCVDRHREDFRRLVAGPMDYVIGNVHEWTSLYQTEDLEASLAQASRDCRLVICTRSGEDALLIEDGRRVTARVDPVVPVDATGAGDQFAAGLIYGLASGRPLEVAGRMATLAAAEVIGHVGPRPQADLREAFRAERLI
ncbi:MAG: adenosine kinase [Paracoccus sp. (in: a-proteobacteria)]|uniref:adenosine kinase n=1 Tax=Paracoccus sp. TaxID=267 RepID=UPI0026E09CC7|nr:adenosine kinase [Paracoccus sp. (in: a-proteobacteria)]MDO5621542.1 adenosine kinase [Paracoccus sp. (in: a-proteobacteria)]